MDLKGMDFNNSFDTCTFLESKNITKVIEIEISNFEIVQIVVTFLLFIWSSWISIKLYQKFYHENVEPAIVVELVFLINFIALFGGQCLLSGLGKFRYVGSLICPLSYWARLSFYADICLVYLDKLIALYWNAYYKDMVTKSRMLIACTASKTFTLIWTIISNSVYR